MKNWKLLIIIYMLFHMYNIKGETFSRILLGYGIYGAGNIINSSGQGLELIESGVNNQFLISPFITPFVESIGPIYRISDFDISSYSFDIQFGNRSSNSEYGLSLNYFDLAYDLRLPRLFINTKKFLPDTEIYLPFNNELNGRSLLASVIQLELFYNYFFWNYEALKLFIGTGFGIGNGKLTYSGPYINEIHANINLGFLYEFNNWELFLNIKNSGFTAKTGPSSFIDRRKVLVNPRRGEIIISTLQLGFTFPLTRK